MTSRALLRLHQVYGAAQLWNMRSFGSFKDVKILNPSATFLTDEIGIESEDAAKKPVRLQLVAGKTYSFCTCGLSALQPWCDGTEKKYGFTRQRPINFEVAKDGEYCLCMCKKSKTRPICDGTHKSIDQTPKQIQEDRTRFFAVSDDTEVYDGEARKLGYKTKGGGFQLG